MRRHARVVFVSAALCAFLGLSTNAAADLAPAVTIDAPTNVSYTSAHVSGTVNPEGGPSPTYWHFEYTTEPVSPDATWSFASASGAFFGAEAEATDPIPVGGDLSLSPGTEYAVRLVAENGEGANLSATEAPHPTLTTDPVAAPTLTINPASAITGTAAHLSGTVDPNGTNPAFDSSWHFECTPQCPGLAGGTVSADGASHPVSEDATGLDPNTSYEVRLIASNAGGQSEAGPAAFETGPVAPEAQTLFAGSLGSDSARIAARVNPRNSATTYQFEWGASGAFDHVAPLAPSSLGASDNAFHFVATPIEGLEPGVEYRFRVVATNANTSEVTVGAAHAFRTLVPAGPPAPCANATVRTQQASGYLSDCRAYELVSPANKNGGNLTQGVASTLDGERIAATSSASFADPTANQVQAPYVSERWPSGWVTTNMSPPVRESLGLNGFLMSGSFSRDLGVSISSTRSGSGEPEIRNIFATSLDGTTTWLTAPTQPSANVADKALAGLSADAGHVLFETTESYSPRDTFEQRQLWEWDNGEVRLVGVLPDGTVAPNGATAGTGINGIESSATGSTVILAEPTVISDDGSRIFFAANGVGGGPLQLFAREDGTTTVEVSLSQKPGSVGTEGATGSTFLGAAADGSRVLFLSADELTADATPGGGIYQYDLNSGLLRFLTPDLAGASGPQIEGASYIAADATRVYFVAAGQLLSGQGEEGGHNLYVADGGGVRFIASLAEVDRQDWVRVGGPNLTARATPDGEHFAFQSVKALTGDDSGGHIEIYQWDDANETLVCASCLAGHQAQGDASLLSNPAGPFGELPSGQPQNANPRSFSGDGRSLFFQTVDDLAPRDVNGKADVYEFRDGRTHLLSSGAGSRGSEILDNSPSGRDVFITTYDSLAPQDVDRGGGDIYDVRAGGGFEVADPAGSCEGGDCQGQGAGTPSFRPPGSASLSVGGSARRGHGRARATQRLRRALAACREKPPKVRGRCESKARNRYGAQNDSSKSRGAK